MLGQQFGHCLIWTPRKDQMREAVKTYMADNLQMPPSAADAYRAALCGRPPS